ncbi:YbgC/FadM family acyl-CoA thioesterase [Serpentinimonas barnesii]|uniref:YbgC/FadM family acyl-CoA thioesterase n=1 Tax=Serpentinimonas barnesii TaxID=1458427 RepID=UPI000498103D|nr:YbgC/FadM family acyl-CoA thioesterase [Serpentinimonas barnesii]
MKPQDFRFSHRLRVRWSEVDMQKIVFNAHYLAYFDLGVSEYWRTLGLPYEDAMAQLGGELYLKKTTLEFNASARMDDQLDVALACQRLGNSSMTLRAAVLRAEQPLAVGELVYVFADPATQRPRPLPQALRALIEGFEAGQPVLELRTGGWAELGPDAQRVRTAVFVEEQGIAREDEWDAADADCLHVVAYNRLGQPVATARLLPAQAGVAKLGRMAVHRVLRGTGVGRNLVSALTQAAQARGDHCLRLSAQRSAQGFYRRLGFETVGQPYDEVGIAHIEMQRRL